MAPPNVPVGDQKCEVNEENGICHLEKIRGIIFDLLSLFSKPSHSNNILLEKENHGVYVIFTMIKVFKDHLKNEQK